MEAILEALSAEREILAAEYIGFLRLAVPSLAIFLLIRCVTSLDLLRPIRLSQWVMGICVPSAIFSHAQISGSRRKVSSGRKHRSSSKTVSTGRARRRKPTYSEASNAGSAGR